MTESLSLPGALAATRGQSDIGGKGKFVGIGELGAAGRSLPPLRAAPCWSLFGPLLRGSSVLIPPAHSCNNPAGE